MRSGLVHGLKAGVVAWLGLASFAPASAHAGAACPAEFTGDCVLDISDVLVFVVEFDAGKPGADLHADGVYDFLDVLAFLIAFGEGCDPIDSDFDGLGDCVETGTGVYLGPGDTGTDPDDPDTDRDGLRDGDEVLGTPGGLDLPAFGVSPVRRDILVEVDWFAGEFQGSMRDFRPTPGMVERVRAAFADAPLVNPDGTTGVNIVIDYGQGGAFAGGQQLPGSPDFIQFDDDFNAYKALRFASNRKGYFHYAIFANRYNTATNVSSGVAEINGDDFMVTLAGSFSDYNAATTFVHEIGHNLNLRHGGFENRNYKPNYNSVMNYRHQFPGADTDGDSFGNGRTDYSRGLNLDIDENFIFEPQGVIGIPIDFNRDGDIDTAFYALNLNCSGPPVPCGTSGTCYDSFCSTLRDNDDWGSINWQRLLVSEDRLPGPREISECDNWPGK